MVEPTMPSQATVRRRWLVTLAAGLCLVLPLAGWQGVAHDYALESRVVENAPVGATLQSVDGVNEHRFPMAEGAAYRIVVPIANSGPFLVQITRFGANPHEFPQSRYPITSIELNADPVRTVTVKPHQTLLVTLTMRSDAPGSIGCARDFFDALRLRFTVLGVERDQALPLTPPIAFEGGPDCDRSQIVGGS
ncbi:hypothetical protein AB0H43_36680 [Hamadaea sp. NPDC050747]|uniref:hypothetical protein n=1 Tax=Hamadaea sp. NPDC050747 TaxID=3155789 RepID=UPI00340CAE19